MNNLRVLVKTYYDFQNMRIRTGNRLKLKKDGDVQKNGDNLSISAESVPSLVDMLDESRDMENKIKKDIQAELKGYPIYNDFLKDVKGMGPIMAAVILSEYNIHIASTVSKLWQFTGLNPGMVRGRKIKDGKVYTTDQLIRGDKLTKGYLSPFNKWLRTKMVGVLADSFIRSQSEYALNYYYPYKSRLENHAKWADTTKAHRDRAAKRYMIKMFLKDLYVAWRSIEGLEVRDPVLYQEEYLGHKHAG